jgi:hypothetical protein
MKKRRKKKKRRESRNQEPEEAKVQSPRGAKTSHLKVP